MQNTEKWKLLTFVGFVLLLLFGNIHSNVYYFPRKKIEGFIKLDPFRLNSSQRIFEDAVKINTIRIS